MPAAADFEVTGAEPVLASPHFLATGAAAARVLTGLAAATLWRQRTGRRQRVVVDARPVGQPEQSLESLAARAGAARDRPPAAFPAWHQRSTGPRHRHAGTSRRRAWAHEPAWLPR